MSARWACASVRMRPASLRASASWSSYCFFASAASACAFSAFSIPPSMAAERSAKVFSKTGQTFFSRKK